MRIENFKTGKGCETAKWAVGFSGFELWFQGLGTERVVAVIVADGDGTRFNSPGEAWMAAVEARLKSDLVEVIEKATAEESLLGMMDGAGI